MPHYSDKTETGRRHWRRTSRLMGLALAVWAVLGLVVPALAPSLDNVRIFGFPLGFLLTAQGSPLGFVVLVFWYAARQNRIDEDCRVAED